VSINGSADVSVIIVSWNVRDLLRACIGSLEGPEGVSVEVIVVDNASRDASAKMVQRELPHVHLVANSENIGFSRANNVGLGHATARYVFFLNPDTVVRPGSLRQMVAFLDQNDEFDMVGPQLVSGDGTPQPPSRLPSVARALWNAVYLHRVPGVKNLLEESFDAGGDDEGQEVDAISGAAMFARRHTIEEIGGFDASFLYTCEDIDLCLRMRARGSRIFYLRRAEVIHFGGQSSDQVWARSGTASVLSTGLYFERFHGRLHAFGFRLTVQLVHMPLMIAVGLTRVLVGRGTSAELRERLKFAEAIWRWRMSD
jgi:N-acetylglucosaminyl-diphospho-decaprenol L-rhamnosyltransferase